MTNCGLQFRPKLRMLSALVYTKQTKSTKMKTIEMERETKEATDNILSSFVTIVCLILIFFPFYFHRWLLK